jgi:hypothetical protein
MTAVLTDPRCGGEDARAALSQAGEAGYKAQQHHRLVGCDINIIER